MTVTPGRSPLARLAAAQTRTVVRVVLLVALVAAFTFAGSGLWSTGNVYSLGQSFALLGLVSTGLALTMMAGEFDLSVGAMVAVAGILAIKTGEGSPLLGIAAAVGLGLAVGLVNALLIVRFRISSLVVTVGSLIFLTGLAFKLAAGKTVAYERFDVAARLDQPILEVLSLRSLVTIGILAAFCISGASAALAGALLSYSLASGAPSFSGTILLQAASAAIIGGVALVGGIGSAGGVAIGALILTILNNGLGLLGASSATVSLMNGAILLGVVLLDARRQGRITDLFARLRSRPPPEVPATNR